MLEESEEEEDSVRMSVSRDGDRSLKIVNKGIREPGVLDGLSSSQRRRVVVDGEGLGDESFFIEEIIEESEEESDDQDYNGINQNLSNLNVDLANQK